MNKITTTIEGAQSHLDATLDSGENTPEKLATLSETLNLTVEEHSHFQNLKSIAQMDERLTVDEAMTVYRLLGNTHTVFNKRTVAAKIVLMVLFRDLAKRSC